MQNDSDIYYHDFVLYGREDVKQIWVTGSFDNWSGNTHKLTHIPSLYWIISLPFKWGEKITYKYIIDGEWTVEKSQSIEADERGLENNVFTAPQRPEQVTKRSEDTPVDTTTSTLPAATGLPAGAGQADSATKKAEAPSSTNITSTSSSSIPATATTSSKSVGNNDHEMVEGVRKVAPGVVEAVPGKSTVDDATLAKPEGSVKTEEKPTLPEKVAAPAIGTSDPVVAPASSSPKISSAPSTSGPSQGKGLAVPIGAADAMNAAAHPKATSASAHQVEGQGLFTVVSHLASAAAGVVTHAVQDVTHRLTDETPASPTSISSMGSEQPKTATQTPAPGLTGSSASQPTIPSNDFISKEVSAHPKPTAQAPSASSSPKAPAAALSGIATGDTTDKITRELASVDLNKTKQEITGAVEKLGEQIAGGLAAIGAPQVGGQILSAESFLGTRTKSATTSAFGQTSSSSTGTSSSPAPSSKGAAIPPAAGAGAFHPAAAAPIVPASLSNSGNAVSTSTTTAVAAKEPAPAPIPTATGNTANVGSSDVIQGPYTTEGKTGTTTSHKELDFTSGTSKTASGSGATAVAAKGPAPAAVPTPTGNTANAGSSDVIQGAYTTEGKTGTTTSHKDLDFTSGAGKTAAGSAATGVAASTSSQSKGSDVPAGAVGKTAGIPDEAVRELKAEADKESKNGTTGPGTASGVKTNTPVASTTTPTSTIGRKDGADKKREASSLGVSSGAAAAAGGPPSTPKKTDGAAAPGSAAPSTAGKYQTAPSTPSGTPSTDRKRKSSFFNKIKSALSPNNK